MLMAWSIHAVMSDMHGEGVTREVKVEKGRGGWE